MPATLHRLLRLNTHLLLIAVALLAVAGCDNGESRDSVTGQVVDVVSNSIAEFETLTIRDEDGEVWEFKGGLFAGFTPSHLREHRAIREPVRVWYAEVDGELRVMKIEDG